MSDIVQKLWGFCHTLRHDGVDYGDYIEQLTYLLFLKMADERGIDLTKIPWRTRKENTPDCSWTSLIAIRHAAHRPLRRGPSRARATRRIVRRNLHASNVALQQPRQPAEARSA